MESRRDFDAEVTEGKFHQQIYLKDVCMIDEKGKKIAIGIGFVNRDDTINVLLDFIPINWNGRLHIRNRQPKKASVRS